MNVDTGDEETPLLVQTKKVPTPLPWPQFSIVLFQQLVEPLALHVIYPIAPEIIRDLGITNGKESEVGYYVGLIQSLLFLIQAVTVLPWSHLSDRVGRKPVILTGLAGLSLSMYFFGLSKTFWALVLSRSLEGALNGNVGVVKSLVGELTDETNISKAYTYLPIAGSAARALGPIIGGSLSRPVEKFPNLFGDSAFLKEYPYFLPCAVPATFSLLAWLVIFFFLLETVRAPIGVSELLCLRPGDAARVEGENEDEAAIASLGGSKQSPLRETIPATLQGSVIHNGVDFSRVIEETPFPPRSLLSQRAIVAAVYSTMLSLIDFSFRAIQPLFLSTPIELGGLGLAPSTIGKVLSSCGVLNGLIQVFFLAKINDSWGSKRIFTTGITAALLMFASFPVINYMARTQGYSWMVWTTLGFQIMISVVVSLSYDTVFAFITRASPNKASLEATNGFNQISASITRAIGSAAANSLFSLSIDKGYLGGQLVYLVLGSVVAVSVFIGTLLPNHWKKWPAQHTLAGAVPFQSHADEDQQL